MFTVQRAGLDELTGVSGVDGRKLQHNAPVHLGKNEMTRGVTS
jgi:hypothetical protein